MVYIYLPVAYYHLNLDVTKENLFSGGVFRCPSGLFCFISLVVVVVVVVVVVIVF